MKPSITVMCDRCGARNTHDDADYVHGRLWCAVCDAWTVHHAVGTLLAGMCDAAQPYWERRECELRRLLEGEGVHVYGLSEPCRTQGGTWWDGALTAEEDSCGGPVWWVEVWENLDVQATVMVLVQARELIAAGRPPVEGTAYRLGGEYAHVEQVPYRWAADTRVLVEAWRDEASQEG